MKKICVIIPIYKTFESLTNEEKKSVEQCFKILGKHSISLITPHYLDINSYIILGKQYRVELEQRTFNSDFFKNIYGYNKLMLSQAFYKSFSLYDYILIYQTDAWVFRDELDEWCELKYDYVGAPWIDWESARFAASHMTIPRTVLSKLGYKQFNLVGNGGLSLRKVSSFVFNLGIFHKAASTCQNNEDYFYSFYVTSFNPFFKIPSVTEALKFAFDENPSTSYKLNNYNLPMSCHAWIKYKSFWDSFIVL